MFQIQTSYISIKKSYWIRDVRWSLESGVNNLTCL